MANLFVTPSTQPGKIAKGKKVGGKPSKGTKKDGRMKGMPGAKSGSAPLPKGKGKGKKAEPEPEPPLPPPLQGQTPAKNGG